MSNSYAPNFSGPQQSSTQRCFHISPSSSPSWKKIIRTLQQLHQALTQKRTLEPILAQKDYKLSEEETWGGALGELCTGMRLSRWAFPSPREDYLLFAKGALGSLESTLMSHKHVVFSWDQGQDHTGSAPRGPHWVLKCGGGKLTDSWAGQKETQSLHSTTHLPLECCFTRNWSW